jgi:NAD(P)-dependent dehydrogenase (short-subunit alcohol dehydrogenase family)
VRAAAEPVGDRLDVLVNNAGIAVGGVVEALPLDELRRQLEVNVIGQVAVTQAFVNRSGPSPQSAAGLAFSPDAQQQFLYVADYGNSHIAVLDRKSLQVLYQFGERSEKPGDFQGLHHLAIDSKGNLYTGEVAPGAEPVSLSAHASDGPPGTPDAPHWEI